MFCSKYSHTVAGFIILRNICLDIKTEKVIKFKQKFRELEMIHVYQRFIFSSSVPV